MIPRECKRLAEVDFPIALVSRHAAKEKEARSGHIPKIHIWPAARPTGSCRSMLLALLLPDPCDINCPKEFKENARRLLPKISGKPGDTDKDLRQALLNFIANFADAMNSTNGNYLEVARELVISASSEEPPLVIDPFAGGGAIPLEALRLGCEAFAGDLNPVACFILNAVLYDIPGKNPNFIEELEEVTNKVKINVYNELINYYPLDPNGERSIAYIWARTVLCESPNCGAEIPLVKSFWLSRKGKNKRALRYVKKHKRNRPPYLEFEIFEPDNVSEIPNATISRAKAKCPCCGKILMPDRVREQLRIQNGGANVVFNDNGHRIGGALLLAVVTLKSGQTGRRYRLPSEMDYLAVWKAKKQMAEILDQWEKNGKIVMCPVPDEPTPVGGGSGAGRAFSIQKYGMLKFGDLFTERQKLALLIIYHSLNQIEMSKECREILSLCIDKIVDMNTALCVWQTHAQIPAHMMSRYAIPMGWDFAEAVPIADSSGSLKSALKRTIECFPNLFVIKKKGTVQLMDATELPLPYESCDVWFTDPPYYDAIPYSDLSDFFFVWLKRLMPDHALLHDPFNIQNQLTPKDREAVQDEVKKVEGKPKDRIFFEHVMSKAFSQGRNVLKREGIGCVVFAHKTTEGWEALLSGMIKGGWTITASWPIATEMGSRLRARDSAALATSVHLICRPRPEEAPIGDWGEVLRELPTKVVMWIDRLQTEGIRGADLVFACIGPALEIFSKYSKVETAEGREVNLSEYLEKVWEVVGRSALEQVLGTVEASARNGMGGALEEDARLTAIFLWTLQSTSGDLSVGDVAIDDSDEDGEEEEDENTIAKTKGFSLVFDVVRRFAQPLGISLPDWDGRIIETKKGVVRLFSVIERARQLFGEESTNTAAEWIEHEPGGDIQQILFPEHDEPSAPRIRGRRKSRIDIGEGVELSKEREATTLDRVHAAMLFQASGQTNALRALIKSEIDRGPDFLRLANALSALYPTGSEEKRLLDAMLLAVPR